mmetsp:Transcript_43919/g.94021  ORF Transcript_43919/g.94021 Transcript_43919/m.94021 type:complete len:782 (+) Transcript_43919:75-2420(+)|eukprot:CAMPEP_0206451522 /NCGR_PEP_ID=MMETSP0324_2-20121206/19395_1 /ASSEMBLY_ACC=CAM_ASM_000836 /TAXON_ID=2866 /ORGANISM="Crypthecodinium cohnii, Strain Seligo" /LENGTH=781 /DNA_ID=CAMNT_0053921427 /DNA_START=73 /DNA_END=2418 /DNA_ORIENTATION=-
MTQTGSMLADAKKSESAQTTGFNEAQQEHIKHALTEDAIQEKRNARNGHGHDGVGAGFKTPSDPGTPRHVAGGIETPTGSPYYGMKHQDACMEQMEHWDWRADAPEFFPGGEEAGFMNNNHVDPNSTGIVWVSSCVAGDGSNVFQPQGWQMNTQAMQNNNGMDNGGSPMQGEDWASQNQTIQQMQEMMNQMEMEMSKMKANWEMERRKCMAQLQRCRALLERYCIPLEEASLDESCFENSGNYYPGYEPEQGAQWGGTAGGQEQGMNAMYNMRGDSNAQQQSQPQQQPSSLDSMLHQLTLMQQEPDNGGYHHVGDNMGGVQPDTNVMEAENNAGFASGALTSQIRNMFTDAKVRTAQDLEDEVFGAEMPPVMRHLQRIQSIVKSTADERAVRALSTLGEKDGLEALSKVEELVESQGGQCRNLSSILQSVCRKIEKKGARGQERNAANKGLLGGSNRMRKEYMQHPSDAGVPVETVSIAASIDPIIPEVVKPVVIAEKTLNRTLSQSSDGSKTKSKQKSWADISSEDEQETTEAETATPPNGSVVNDEIWTPKFVEKVARQRFELRRKDGRWQLKISMCNLEPQLTEAGMVKYADWLQVRLQAFKDEHGSGALHRCYGEVDFSGNNMSDQMLWTLLETLNKFEVHASSLNLNGNKITQGGALAICEFLCVNNRADPLQELHLAHNELDDDAATEILKSLQVLYDGLSQRRCEPGMGCNFAPFWVVLNNNRITDPERVRKQVEKEGISICLAEKENCCNITKCCRREVPMVHLHCFNTQSAH